jgi:hypothetical protein
MVYSTVLDIKGCTVCDDCDPPTYYLEPGSILSIVPKELITQQYKLIVLVRDGDLTLEYEFEKFLAKAYRIQDNKVRIGSNVFNFTSLSIYIGIKIILEDLNTMRDDELD